MKAAAELILTARPLERVVSEIAIAALFVGERPLRGGAARVDWRLCGALSRRIEAGDLAGKSGEAMLIDARRALHSPRMLLLGLGERHSYDRTRLQEETRAAIERCIALGLSHLALAPFGIAFDDVPRHAAALLAGVRDAGREAKCSLVVELSVQRNEMPAIVRAFDTAVGAEPETSVLVSLDESSLDRR